MPRKQGLTARAKKKKPNPTTEEPSLVELSASSTNLVEETVDEQPEEKEEEAAVPEPVESPGKKLRDEAEALEAQALLTSQEAKLDLLKAQAQWKRAQRLHEERMKRWDRADARKPFVGSAVDHLERYWTNLYKHAMARQAYTVARLHALDREAAVYAMQMNVRDREIAHLRRLVRRYEKCSSIRRVFGMKRAPTA